MAIKKSGGSPALRKSKLIIAVIVILLALVFTGVLMLVKSISQQETYYKLNTDVLTRTQITEEMMTPVTTSQGTGPQNVIGIGDIQTGEIFTKFPLLAGDILTKSNSGALEDIATGVPDEWVVTSFGVNADNAVGGRIKRGDYADMMIATAKGATYPFVNILILDTSVSLNSASSNKAAETSEAKAGQTSQYTVAGTAGDMAKLQHIMKTNSGDIKLLLAPRQNQYNPPQLSQYSDGGGMFAYKMGDAPLNLGKGTDYTFTSVQRDAFGRPVKKAANCSQGNGQIDPKLCNQAQPENTTTAAPTAEPTQK